MKLLSFDPASYRNCGYAYLEIADTELVKVDGQVLVTPAQIKEPHRALPFIYSEVDRLMNIYMPDVVIIEKTSSFRSGFITGQIAQCMGSILAAVGKYDCGVVFVYPSAIKKQLTGNGRASKAQVKVAVLEWLGFRGLTLGCKSEHAIDACGNAIGWLVK